MRRGLLSILKIAVLGLIVYFLVSQLLDNWNALAGYDWSFDPVLMLWSTVLFMVGYALLPVIWRRLLIHAGYRIGFGEAWDIYYLGNLGRYIPGKVWVIAGMSILAGKSGVPRSTAGAAAVYAQVYSMAAMIVFFIGYVILHGALLLPIGSVGTAGTVVLLVAALGAAVVSPRFVGWCVNALLVRLGREPVSIGLSPMAGIELIALYGLSWVFMGVGFGYFVAAVAGWGTVPVVTAACVYVVAYAVGFLALFTPGGLGVREGVMGMLLAGMAPVSVGIVIAALSRLLVTAIELAYVGIVAVRKGVRQHG